jgi:hypothetical protein
MASAHPRGPATSLLRQRKTWLVSAITVVLVLGLSTTATSFGASVAMRDKSHDSTYAEVVDQMGQRGMKSAPVSEMGTAGSFTNGRQVCHDGAKWLRLTFGGLNLTGDDWLRTKGSEGGSFTFRGHAWKDRKFTTRAFSGDCVRLTGSMNADSSSYSIVGMDYGTRPLRDANPVVAGAGDLCGPMCESTSDQIEQINPDAVFTAGDNAYNDGTYDEFMSKYDPTWGRFKDKTHPSPGNHEYNSDGSGYYEYFGDAAGDPARGYYSWDIGDWHFISLNSNIDISEGSEEVKWLKDDLAANTKPCTAAYEHHPRYSRGDHGSNTDIKPIWNALDDADADILLSGHDHNYQRYALQDADGNPSADGVRQFVVGSGGQSLYDFNADVPNFEAGDDGTYGVLKMTLSSTDYAWDFVPQAGREFTDSGSQKCHKASS